MYIKKHNQQTKTKFIHPHIVVIYIILHKIKPDLYMIKTILHNNTKYYSLSDIDSLSGDLVKSTLSVSYTIKKFVLTTILIYYLKK